MATRPTTTTTTTSTKPSKAAPAKSTAKAKTVAVDSVSVRAPDSGDGSSLNPWSLQTPPRTSAFTMHRDTRDGVDVLVCTVGKTVLLYEARCIEDLHAMLITHGEWMELGSADEQKPAKEGTVEAWGRSSDNPVGGWYGLKKGLRGRFGMYLPPLMERLGLVELEHNAKGNRMRAISQG